MAPEPTPSPGDTEPRPADASPKNALSRTPFSKKFPLRSTLLVPSGATCTEPVMTMSTAIERLIKSSGFRVQAFASAEDFLRSGNHRDTACLILDVRLPGMSGLELQRQLAASHSRVPIIFVSAHDDQEAPEKALRAGTVAFLSKPFSDEALLTAVRSALE